MAENKYLVKIHNISNDSGYMREISEDYGKILKTAYYVYIEKDDGDSMIDLNNVWFENEILNHFGIDYAKLAIENGAIIVKCEKLEDERYFTNILKAIKTAKALVQELGEKGYDKVEIKFEP